MTAFRYLLSLMALAGVAIFSHWRLQGASLDQLHADYAPLWTVAEEISRGEWRSFVFSMHYAGVVLTVLRALWLKIYLMFSPGLPSGWAAQAWFSFGIMPALFSWMTLWSVSRLFSARIALCVAFVVAIGSTYLDGCLHNDVYSANCLFGLWVLGFRVVNPDPLRTLSAVKLWGLGVLSGLMFYNSRMSLIALVVLWAPPYATWVPFLKRMLPTDRLSRCLFRLALVLVGMFLYLEIYGANLGSFFGRRVILHASPNLMLAMIPLAIILLRNGVWAGVRPFKTRFLWVALGASIGFLPEVAHWIHMGSFPPPGNQQTRGIPEALAVLGRIPVLLGEIVEVPGSGWGLFSKWLWLGGVIGLLGTAWKVERYRSILLFFGLSLLSFCRIQNYAGVTSRYLLPALPVLCFGMAWGFEFLQRRRWGWFLAMLLVSVHTLDMQAKRREMEEQALQSGRWNAVLTIVRKFQEEGVRVVGSDNYWFSNELSVASGMNPVFFVFEGVGLIHESAPARWLAESRVGLMLRSQPADTSRFSARGESWKLQSIGDAYGSYLYIATRNATATP